jgi:uncharacterized membrane protein
MRVVVGAMLAGILLAGSALFYWLNVPSAAARAAQREYSQQTGARDITVSRYVRWQTCAVVKLAGVPATGVVSVIVKKQGDQWKLARVSREAPGQSFDSDGVPDSDTCLLLAEGK